MACCLMSPSHYLNQYFGVRQSAKWVRPSLGTTEPRMTLETQMSTMLTLDYWHPSQCNFTGNAQDTCMFAKLSFEIFFFFFKDFMHLPRSIFFFLKIYASAKVNELMTPLVQKWHNWLCNTDGVPPKKYPLSLCLVLFCYRLVIVISTHILLGLPLSASEKGCYTLSFTHFRGYFIGTGTIIWFSQCQWSNPEGYGKIRHVNSQIIDDIAITK